MSCHTKCKIIYTILYEIEDWTFEIVYQQPGLRSVLTCKLWLQAIPDISFDTRTLNTCKFLISCVLISCQISNEVKMKDLKEQCTSVQFYFKFEKLFIDMLKMIQQAYEEDWVRYSAMNG